MIDAIHSLRSDHGRSAGVGDCAGNGAASAEGPYRDGVTGTLAGMAGCTEQIFLDDRLAYGRPPSPTSRR